MRLLVITLLLLHALVLRGQESWLKPDFATVQYAGSIGYISGGVGYDVFKKHALSLHFGYVPESKGGPLNILATKLVFNLSSLEVSEKVTISPFSAGVMMSYHFGTQFRSRWPSHRYPDGYYWWKTSLRAHLLVQTSLTLQLKGKAIHSMTCFVEANTNELYLISFIKNSRSLTLGDVVKVGYGFRARF